jgi:tRNA pseudouridine38-40 synthase
MPTQRYKLTIAYRGSRYHGWQRQIALPTWKGPTPPPGQGIPTIQEILKREIMGAVAHPITLVGSSRTDAGVHAKGQIAHFDTTQTQIPPDGLRRAINHQLPEDILIREIEPVPDWFDAIQSTTSKRYQYFIWNAPDRNAFFPDLCWHRWQELNLEAMKKAAEHFVGEHDFASFAKPGHGRQTSIREIYQCRISVNGPRVIIGVEGNGFLWNMVRIIVGTLLEVGLDRTQPADIPKILEARDRRAAGQTAPPQGLFLQWIKTAKEKREMDFPAIEDESDED